MPFIRNSLHVDADKSFDTSYIQIIILEGQHHYFLAAATGPGYKAVNDENARKLSYPSLEKFQLIANKGHFCRYSVSVSLDRRQART